MKSYSTLGPRMVVGLVAPLGFGLFMFALILLTLLRARPAQRPGLMIFAAIALGISALFALVATRICHTVELGESGAIFRRAFSRTEIPAGSIRSIRQAILYSSCLRIRAEGATVILPTDFTGFHEVVAELRRQNPAATVTGC